VGGPFLYAEQRQSSDEKKHWKHENGPEMMTRQNALKTWKKKKEKSFPTKMISYLCTNKCVQTNLISNIIHTDEFAVPCS